MKEKVAHWMTQSFDELRALGPYATAALVTGGSVSSVLATLVWLYRRRHAAGPRT